MGNTNKPNIIKYKHTFWNMDDEEIEEIKKYKIIEVDELDKFIINQIMISDNYFNTYPTKSKVINNMLNYCLEHNEKENFKTTDYICNKKIKVCINLRKIIKNNTEEKNISWVKKS